MVHAGRNSTSAGRPTGSLDFASTFKSLKRAVKRHAGFLTAQTDTGTEYILTGPMMERWKKELWFGGVRQGKSYVSLHLMAVYMFPDLLDGISPELRARTQGKSCFNFKRIEPPLLDEVDGLIAPCVERLRTERILSPGRNSPTRPIQPMDQVVESALQKRITDGRVPSPARVSTERLPWMDQSGKASGDQGAAP